MLLAQLVLVSGSGRGRGSNWLLRSAERNYSALLLMQIRFPDLDSSMNGASSFPAPNFHNIEHRRQSRTLVEMG